MALLMWEYDEETLAKAVVACNLYKAMAYEAGKYGMKMEVFEKLRSYRSEFENIGT